MPDLYVALIHHPIVNKEGKTVTTSVTNFDLHDLSRNCQTFGVKKLFIVTPMINQLNMVNYIRDYWQEGFGSQYNPSRKQAFDVLQVSPNIEDTCLTIKKLSGKEALLVATTAKYSDKSVGYSFVRNQIEKGDRPILLVFGTGFGLAPEFFAKVHYVLEPIYGAGDYNHLPVRSAVAIILDRLVGRN